MLWKEGMDVRLRSVSNSHIDVEVREEAGQASTDNPMQAKDEKMGWLDRDVSQMRNFRDCLSGCALSDLGFIGLFFTWCNERVGEQRTLIRLDRFVANEDWRRLFPEACIFNSSMSASDHCLLTLWLKKKIPSRPKKRRFLFEVMWTREESCKEVVEEAWDPLNANPKFNVIDRIKNC